jgi:recombination protein RecA
VQKSGAWFSFGDTRLGQGRENAKLFLRDNPEIAAQVEVRVREMLGTRGVGASSSDDGANE